MTIIVRPFEKPIDDGWFAIYDQSFPLHERMSREFFDTQLSENAGNISMLALLSQSGATVGISYTEYVLNGRSAFLYYIAIDPNVRGQGFGATLYAKVVADARDRGCEFLFLEVEIPEPGDNGLPARRIGWYRRNGARLLGGIEYTQRVDTTDIATPMHLMAHAFRELSAPDAFAALKEYCGDSLSQAGEPRWVDNGFGKGSDDI